MKKIRCAIYTRKSSEDGLEQEFNSLHAQREACAAYIASQKHEGWVMLPGQYDDGGLSGGSLDRPALQHLLADVRDGQIDQIVVYKIDRLTRSLSDFAKIVDILDAAGASFVSVTQSFNTATSMGRLTLNMLLSFAQFEREVTAERIRDKIAASKRRGLWMGGQVPMGYDPDGRTLRINEAEAETILTLYALYEQHGTIRQVKETADALGLRTRRRTLTSGETRGGGAIDRGHIHHILTNPIYAGRIRHRDKVHDGQHDPIIAPERWEALQLRLQGAASRMRHRKTPRRVSLLCGKLFDETGDRLTPSHSRTKKATRLRYYVSNRLIARSGEEKLDGWRLPADQLEAQVNDLVRRHLAEPGFAGRVCEISDASEIARIRRVLTDLTSDPGTPSILGLVERIGIAPGLITVNLGAERLAKMLGIDADALDAATLQIDAPFQVRKRGVETKIILAESRGTRDEALIRNIALAHHWLERIKAGETFGDISKTDGISKRRAQHMIDLAFLAPDIIRDVLEGKQPLGFTSEWCKARTLPSDWQEQRALLATL
ncbi:recombinase family protein [Roseovarius aestuariivivens]|uniref:recombinase family protein n=1 Tax=Roseovarius aestuariivivens TaxID=1888910 RepID=UPI00108175A3|nr:recombinase family protein [Roseovarius aestuariivivens]